MLLHGSAHLNLVYIAATFLFAISSCNADALRQLWSADLRDSGWRPAIFDPNGDIIKIASGPTPGTHFIEKLDGKNGSSKWKQIANYNLLGFTCFNTDYEGNLLIGSGTSITNLDASQAVARKISGETGHLLWERTWTNAPYISSILSDTNGNIAVHLGLTVAKIAPDGTELWQKRLGPVTTPAVIGIAKNGDVGRISHLDRTIRVVKFRAQDGAIILDRESTVTNEIAYFNDLAVADDGSIAFTATGYPPTGSTMFTGKVSAEGQSNWTRWYSNPLVSSCDGQAVLPLPNGDVIALCRGGFVDREDNTSTELERAGVVRYDGATGTVKWERVFEGSPTYGERPETISITPAGNILLSNQRNDGLANIYELDSSDGQTRWSDSAGYYYFNAGILHAPSFIAVIGSAKSSTGDYLDPFTTLRLFTFGPELTTCSFPNHLEISWEPENRGWTLQQSTSSHPLNWLSIEGSTTTNLLRLPKSESATMFRLIRE